MPNQRAESALARDVTGDQRVMHFLRGALGKGTAVVSLVEEMAEKNGIGSKKLEDGKLLGVKV